MGEQPTSSLSRQVGPPAAERRRSWRLPAAVSVCLVLVALALPTVYLIGRALVRPEEAVCRRFMALKNADDPLADELLAPRPAAPEQAVSQEEADRLDADFMLHQPFHVREVHPFPAPKSEPKRFVLVVEGSLASERIRVRTPTGVEAAQRCMWSPDLLVEVREGKIHGIKPRLHED